MPYDALTHYRNATPWDRDREEDVESRVADEYTRFSRIQEALRDLYGQMIRLQDEPLLADPVGGICEIDLIGILEDALKVDPVAFERKVRERAWDLANEGEL